MFSKQTYVIHKLFRSKQLKTRIGRGTLSEPRRITKKNNVPSLNYDWFDRDENDYINHADLSVRIATQILDNPQSPHTSTPLYPRMSTTDPVCISANTLICADI